MERRGRFLGCLFFVRLFDEWLGEEGEGREREGRGREERMVMDGGRWGGKEGG